MPTLVFEGYSDDTFGETLHTKDDYDNCASGRPIEYLVWAADESMIVFGQHCPGHAGGWMIGVASHDPDCEDMPIPAWPIRVEPSSRGYSPQLIIDAPDGVEIRCMQREP